MLVISSTDLLQNHSRSHCTSIDGLAHGLFYLEMCSRLQNYTVYVKISLTQMLSRSPPFNGIPMMPDTPTQHVIIKLRFHAKHFETLKVECSWCGELKPIGKHPRVGLMLQIVV